MASVLSVTGFLQSAAPIASAEPEVSFPALPETEANLAYSDNTFGSMVAREINLERARLGATAVVHDVVLNEGIAQVSLESASDATAVVCVFSDPSERNAPKLLGTGMQAFTADETLIDVPVSLSSMPEYYLVRVYVVGENQVPLSMEYTDSMHTSMMQEVLQSEISDYEGYEVLNLDENDDTNFAVYNKDVQVLHSDGTHDIVLNQDLENGIYLIRNYTGEIKKGSVVAIDAANHGAAVFKISSLETDGDVTTVHADPSYNTDDAFEFVKLDADSSNNTLTLTPPDPEESYGLEYTCFYDGEERPAQGRPARGGMSAASAEEDEDDYVASSDSVHFRVQFGKGQSDLEDVTGVDLSGFVDFCFNYNVSFYKSSFLSSVQLDMALSVELGAEIAVTAEKQIPLPYGMVLNPVGDVIIQLGPFIDLSITGQIDISTVFSASFGTGKKFTSNASVTDLSLTVEGFIGIGIGGSMWLMKKGGELSVLVGLQADFKLNSPHEGCGRCSDITLSFVGKLNASLDLGIVDVGVEPKLEHELLHCYLSDELGFGWGECPNLNGNGSQDPEDDPQEDPEDDPTEPKKSVFSKEESRVFSFAYRGEIDGKPVATLTRRNCTQEDRDAIVDFTVPEYDQNGFKVVAIDNFCFYQMTNLKRVKMHDNILNIGQFAFYNLKNLEEADLPRNLLYMGKSAFEYSGVREIRIPYTLRVVPERAFYLCTNVKKLEIQMGITAIEKDALCCGSNMEPVRIPSSVETLGENAMNACVICSPIYVRNIGKRALSGCHFYDPVTKTNTAILSPFIKHVAEEGFYGMAADKVVFPGRCTTVFEKGSFMNSTVKEAVLPENMKKIPEEMFRDCSKMEKVDWPDYLTEVGPRAFYGCVHLLNGDFPRTLRKIDDYSFYKCWELAKDTALMLPYGLKEIGHNAFFELIHAKEIYIPETVEKMFFSSVHQSAQDLYFLTKDVVFLDDPETIKKQYNDCSYSSYITVHGYDGSTAQAFAQDKDHYYKFRFLAIRVPSVPQYTDALTKTFTGLKPNTVYNFYDLLGTEFTAANLLYLSQGISDENGTLTVWYRPAKSAANSQQFVRCMEPDVSETTASVTTTTAKVTTTTAKVTTTTAKVTTTTAKVTTTTAKVTTTTKTNTTTTSAATTSSGKTTTTAKTTTSATTPAPISYVKGDISGDFKVDVSDAVLLARFCTEDKNVKISTQGVLNADVDKNGNADSDDLVMILQYIARIINKFA